MNTDNEQVQGGPDNGPTSVQGRHHPGLLRPRGMAVRGADMKLWIHSRCFWCMVHMGLISPFDQRFRLYNYTGKLQ